MTVRRILILIFITSLQLVPISARAEGEFVVMPTVEVTASADRGWNVTYHFDEAVDRVLFYRPSTPRVQTDFWQIRSIGFEGRELDEGGFLLARTDGQKFTRFEYYIPNYRFFIEKDYFDAFSFDDGGQLLYSGHLAAIGSVGDIEDLEQTLLLSGGWRMIARALDGENIVTTAGVFKDEAELFFGFDDGTFLYFGPSEPIENDFMRAIVDKEAPEWILEPLENMLPALAEFYTEKFGKRLNYKPLTFVSTNLKSCTGKGAKAGVLPQLLQIDLACSGWNEPDSYLFWLLGHESAHFWNGGLFEKAEGDENYWMSEGAATYLASRALLDLGYFDQETFEARLAGDIERCDTYLANHQLSTAASQGNFSAYYDCGSKINALSDQYIIEAGGGQDIFTLWNMLFERATFHNYIYTSESYFDILNELGVSDNHISDLRELVH